MGTAMFARGFAGAVIDGGVRDLPQLKKIGFPLILTHVAAGSELSVVCELNRYEILRDVAERYAIAHAE